MKITRALNVELVDRAIISRGWTFSEAAARLGISRTSLVRIYKGKNVNNKIILKISHILHIPLEQLITWQTHGNNIQAG